MKQEDDAFPLASLLYVLAALTGLLLVGGLWGISSIFTVTQMPDFIRMSNALIPYLSYQPANGRVTLFEQTDSKEATDTIFLSSGPDGHLCMIEYSYVYGNIFRKSTIFNSTQVILSDGRRYYDCQNLKTPLSIGQEITVYVDPKDPARSVVYKGLTGYQKKFYTYYFAALVTFLAPIIYIIWYNRKNPRAAAQAERRMRKMQRELKQGD